MYYKNDMTDLEESGQMNEYLTPKEVMDILYIGKNTLYKLLSSGELKRPPKISCKRQGMTV